MCPDQPWAVSGANPSAIFKGSAHLNPQLRIGRQSQEAFLGGGVLLVRARAPVVAPKGSTCPSHSRRGLARLEPGGRLEVVYEVEISRSHNRRAQSPAFSSLETVTSLDSAGAGLCNASISSAPPFSPFSTSCLSLRALQPPLGSSWSLPLLVALRTGTNVPRPHGIDGSRKGSAHWEPRIQGW